ncbi:MAG: hypothetical protein PHE26_00855 [Syntrophomonadaceae bacterium]|nr:hypothetical protein [Syntrophomonadaceae bacterium]
MLTDFMDNKESFIDDVMSHGKVDPGTFSFLEPGWWALHAATIAGIYMLGQSMSKSRHSRD